MSLDVPKWRLRYSKRGKTIPVQRQWGPGVTVDGNDFFLPLPSRV